jgi:hypothetical protein
MAEWLYENEIVEELPEKSVGFVYKITNLIDGRIYYGKKKSTFRKTALKTVTLKSGVKKKKKIRSEVSSDWKTYYGSSLELNTDVSNLGQENFKREILQHCYSLTELSYYESRIQFVTDCLLYPDKYYNSWISSRVRRDHLIKKQK